MKKTDFDETKIPPVMEMIEKAAELMEEKDCEGDGDAKRNLAELQRKLREATGNKKLQIKSFQRYWNYTESGNHGKEGFDGSALKG